MWFPPQATDLIGTLMLTGVGTNTFLFSLERPSLPFSPSPHISSFPSSETIIRARIQGISRFRHTHTPYINVCRVYGTPCVSSEQSAILLRTITEGKFNLTSNKRCVVVPAAHVSYRVGKVDACGSIDNRYRFSEAELAVGIAAPDVNATVHWKGTR